MSGLDDTAAGSRIGGVVLSVVPALLVAAAWEASSRFGLVADYILPAPTEILIQLWASGPMLLKHARVTGVEILLGFLMATVVGVVLGVAMVFSRTVERMIFPWIVAMQAVPKVAIGPLLIMWLGFGVLPKVIITFLIAVFPILVNTITGLRSAEPDMLHLLRSMGASRLRTFWYVQIPSALPSILSGMRVAVTLSVVGALVGEFIGANEGLGYLILFANGLADAKLMFAAILVIVGLSMSLFWAIAFLDRMLLPWHVSQRSKAAVVISA